MVTRPSDITFVYSGGSNNVNANASIGGAPSASLIPDDIVNNLFSNISSDQTDSGYTDYRCFYMFNDGDAAIFNINIFIESEVEGGSSMEIGILEKDDVQRITIGGTPTSGTLTISYEGESFVTNYNSDLAVWATDIQDGLNSLIDDDGNPLLQNVVVTAQPTASSIIFDILFQGIDGKRNHAELVTFNTLLPTLSVSVTTIQDGAPVNTEADLLDVETTPPGGVIFSAAMSF